MLGRLSTHPLRFAYALFVIASLLIKCPLYYEYDDIKMAIFIVWILYEYVWAYLEKNNFCVMMVTLGMGFLGALAVYNFSVSLVPLAILLAYLGYGIWLNVVTAEERV